MKNSLSLVLFLVLSQNCIAENNSIKSVTEVDTMTYSIMGFNSGITLLLLSNNQFIKESSFFDCVSVTTTSYVFGEYKQDGNEIKLTPKKVRLFIEDSNDKLTKDTTVSYDKSVDKIKTNYYQVEVKGVHYLLSNEFISEFSWHTSKTNDFQKLVKDIEDENYNWTTYFIANKEPKRIFTISYLPQKYQQILKPLSEKVYSVQLGVFENPENFDKSLVKSFGKTDYLRTKNGLTIIYIGEYKTYEEAKLVKEKLKEEGTEAIVIAVENGEKVPI